MTQSNGVVFNGEFDFGEIKGKGEVSHKIKEQLKTQDASKK